MSANAAGQAFGMTLLLRDDPAGIEAYKRYHRAVWPAVKELIEAIGISKMSIFLRGRRMFMYFEAPDGFDASRDFGRLMDDPRYVEWDRLMRQFQEPAPEADAGEWWAPMELVFDLAWPAGADTT